MTKGERALSQVRLNFNLDITSESSWLTVTAAQAARTSIAYVQELGDFHCGPDYYTTREGLSSYLLKLCVGGEGTLEYGGQSYTVRQGQMFWIDCRKPQNYYTSGEEGSWHLMWVHFFGEPCEAYYRLFLAQNDNSPIINPQSGAAVRNILDELFSIYREGGNTIKDDVRASGLLTLLMTGCIRDAGSIGEDDRLPGYVLDARNYINLHYAERITLDDLARVISINKFYLQKLFKRCIGLSPNEYLIYTRLTQAKHLLLTTDHSISRIAMDVGIDNVGYFTNLFKKYEGCAPSVFRQNWYKSQRSPES